MDTKFRYALFAAAAWIVAWHAALAADPGPYVTVGIGLHKSESATAQAQIPAGTPAIAFRTKFDTGFIGISSIGYKWKTGFRTELEAGYRQSDFGKINGAGADGIQKVSSVSANLLYDFNTASTWTPYVGGGLGISSNKWRHVMASGLTAFDDHATAFQWQGIAGVAKQVSARVKVFADYRYIRAGKIDFGSRSPSARLIGHDDRSHNILVGLRFAFHTPGR